MDFTLTDREQHFRDRVRDFSVAHAVERYWAVIDDALATRR